MITMLRLKNISISGNTAEADFFPEDGTGHGHIVINLESEEIIHIDHAPGYELIYPGHARKQLVRMAKSDDRRSECTVMWY